MVADVISRLRTFGLYQKNDNKEVQLSLENADNDNKEVQLSLEDAVKNIIEEMHHIHSAPTTTTYNKIDKLSLDLLQREQR